MATRKIAKKKVGGSVQVIVGRLDNMTPVPVKVPKSYTIGQAMVKHGYTQADGESIRDSKGNECDSDDIVRDGSAYFLVQDVKSR